MREILVTNDDGVHSEGIKELAAALAHLGKVTIVAPMQEASAIGHALTLRRPLRIETIATSTFGIDGTPTDCVNLAISHVIKHKPDLIVSGINKGWNLGDDVTYSGTVSGALEGALLGIPAIAVSTQNFHRRNEFEFGPAARAAASVAELVLERGMPKFTFLGFLKKGGHQTVFLSNDREIFLVKQGSVIAGNYEVTSLTDEAITITSRSGSSV